MSTVVLILAAGKQARWEMDRAPYYKQLLGVAGETIVARIVRQCGDRNTKPAVIARHPELEWFSGCKPESATWLSDTSRPSRWTVETLFSTNGMWQERTIILLGDVVYSRTIMDRIFAPHEQELKVFGNEYEIYALSFIKQHNFANIVNALTAAVRHAESGVSPGGGKLRKFYQIYCGLDPNSSEAESDVLDRVCYIQDYTRDVDMRRDYIELQNKVVKAGLIDDLETRRE